MGQTFAVSSFKLCRPSSGIVMSRLLCDHAQSPQVENDQAAGPLAKGAAPALPAATGCPHRLQRRRRHRIGRTTRSTETGRAHASPDAIDAIQNKTRLPEPDDRLNNTLSHGIHLAQTSEITVSRQNWESSIQQKSDGIYVFMTFRAELGDIYGTSRLGVKPLTTSGRGIGSS